jgi:hypothetical protein
MRWWILGLGLADAVSDAWTFRERLTKAVIGRPAIEILFQRFDVALAKAGYVAMGGQIVDASIVAAPKQRNTDAEKREIREGRIPAEWAKKLDASRNPGRIGDRLIPTALTIKRCEPNSSYRLT